MLFEKMLQAFLVTSTSHQIIPTTKQLLTLPKTIEQPTIVDFKPDTTTKSYVNMRDDKLI